MNKIPWRTSKNAQNSTRNFKKCTKSQQKLPNMHKISRGSSRKCARSHHWLRIMQKLRPIPWGTSKNAENPIRNFQKSYEKLQKLHNILWVSSKNVKNHTKNLQNAKHPIRNFQKCTRCAWHMLSAFINCVHILTWGEINDVCRLAETNL
jgi:hypothetical protein